jgi:hypothetical protein
LTKLLAAAAFGLTAWTVAAHATADAMFDHNGSVMYTVWLGNGRAQIRYSEPRPTLQNLVSPGTILIDRVWNRSNYFVGTAFIFKHSCGAVPYRVEGGWDETGSRVVLDGAVPVTDRWCNIVGYTWNDSDAHLVFTAIR